MTWRLRAKVRGGRLLLDEPVNLPEGHEIDLIPSEEGDRLDDEDRRRLHEALILADEDARKGSGISAEELFRELDELPES